MTAPDPHADSRTTEAEGEWPLWADRAFTWGMLIAIPVVGVVGFALLTSIKHPHAGELPAPGTPPPHRATLLAAPELDGALPSVQLGKTAPPGRTACADGAVPSGGAPCERPAAPAAAAARSTTR